MTAWAWLAQEKAHAASRRTLSIPEDSKWLQQIASWRAELKIARNFLPFDSLQQSIKGVNLTARTRAILNCVVATKVKGQTSKTKRETLAAIATTIVDLSQNPCRKNFTPASGTNHTLCTSSFLVHLGQFRTVLPSEMLAWQGHNLQRIKFPTRSNRVWRCLAGEGMNLACLGTVIFALHLTGSLCPQAAASP